MSEPQAGQASQKKRIIWPGLKKGHVKLDQIRNDILPQAGSQAGIVNSASRYADKVIELLAEKHKRAVAEGGETEFGECLLFGPEQCCAAFESSENPAIVKVREYLASGLNRHSVGKILAIYTLEQDESDDNRQRFILLAKDTVYIRGGDLAMRAYPTAQIRLFADGIGVYGEAERLLEWELSAAFRSFFKELRELSSPPAPGIAARHPFQDELARFGDAGNNKAATSWLKILLMAASANGNLDAATLLRMEQIALSFQMDQKYFYQLLVNTANMQASSQHYLAALTQALESCPPAQRHVLFMDIIQAAISAVGEIRCKPILEILKRDRFAGAAFVERALAYAQKDNLAAREFKKIIQTCAEEGGTLMRHRAYVGAVNQHILTNGAMIDE